MSKIQLHLEVQDRYGNALKTFNKDVESVHTPGKGMIFTGEDYTLEARNVYFDLDDGSILVRFVENPHEDEINGWDFLSEQGWIES